MLQDMYGASVPTPRTPEPSVADERITVRLKEALALIDVRVLDHFVIGATSMVSFVERGLL